MMKVNVNIALELNKEKMMISKHEGEKRNRVNRSARIHESYLSNMRSINAGNAKSKREARKRKNQLKNKRLHKGER